MRKLEQKMWDRLRPKLKELGVQFDRVESAATAPDFPDLSYTWARSHGFIEFKAAEVDHLGRIDLTHFTTGQRNWLRRRATGGKTWLLIRVSGEIETWYVIRGTLAQALPPRPVLADLKGFLHCRDSGGPVTSEWLREWL